MSPRAAQAEPAYTSRFAAAMVEPSPAGLLAWRELSRPRPTEEQQRAMVQHLIRRGMRASDLDEVRRLGFPLD